MRPTDKMISDLELLLELVPPDQLRKDLSFLLFQYLMLNDPDNPPEKGKLFYENIYFLIDFFDMTHAEFQKQIPEMNPN